MAFLSRESPGFCLKCILHNMFIKWISSVKAFLLRRAEEDMNLGEKKPDIQKDDNEEWWEEKERLIRSDSDTGSLAKLIEARAIFPLF